MKKRGILLLLVVVFLIQQSFAYSNLDLDVVLDKTVYGSGSNFEGELIINYTGDLNADDNLRGRVIDCGAEEWKSIDLKTLLENEGISGFSEEYYTLASGGKTSLGHSFVSAGDLMFGFSLNDNNFYEVLNATMKISGSGGPVRLDIGNDGIKEWDFTGDFFGWYNEIYYPLGVSSNTPEMEIYPLTAGYSACEELYIPVDRKYDPLHVKINSKIRGSGGTYLNASVVYYGNECSFPLGEISSDRFLDFNCSVIIENPEYEEDVLELEICLITDGNYQVPSTFVEEANDDYYFVNLQRGKYDLVMDNDVIIFSGFNFQLALEDYLDDCYLEGVYCTVPVNLSMGGGGDVVLSDLRLIGDPTETNFFYDIEKVPGKKEVNETLGVNLDSFSDLKTPSEPGDCKLQLDFEGSESDLINFSVAELPVAQIEVSSKYVATGISILFDGSSSYSPNNNTIFRWGWDFGDNVTASGSSVSHSYLDEGNYTIELVVTDNESVQSDPASYTIYVGSLENILGDLINEVGEDISSARDYFDNLTGTELEVSTLFGFNSILTDLNVSLEEISANYSYVKNQSLSPQSKEGRYRSLVENLELVKEAIPWKLNIQDSLSVDNIVLRHSDDVPMFSLRTDNTYDYERAIYFFNIQNVNVKMDSYLLEVDYLYGEDTNFVLVEKDVSVTGGNDRVLVEDVGVSLSQVEVLTEGYTYDETYNVFYYELSSSSKSFKYLLKVDELYEINSVVFTDVEIPEEEPGEEEEEEGKGFPWIWFILLAVVLAGGIFYFNFYAGPGNFKVKVNKASIKVFGKRLFTNEQDLNNLRNYVQSSLRKGFRKQDIRKVLLRKGWTNRQVEYAFGEKFK